MFALTTSGCSSLSLLKHQVQRSIRGMAYSLQQCVKRATSVDIIAQKAVIGKIKTVAFEICETVPRKGRFWGTNL